MSQGAFQQTLGVEMEKDKLEKKKDKN